MTKKATADGKGFVKVHYSELKRIEDHLKREHNFEDKCEAIRILQSLWSLGCDTEVAERERH